LSIRWTLFAAFSLLVVAGGGAALLVGYRVTSEAVVGEAQRRMELDLRSAWAQYNQGLERVQSVVQLVALLQKTHDVLGGADPDPDWVRQRLETIRTRYKLDTLSIVGLDGNLLARTRYPYHTGEPAYRDPVLRRAQDKGSAAGTVLLPRQVLEREGQYLAEQAYMEIRETPMAAPSPKAVESDGMMLEAAEAVLDTSGRVQGWVLGGVLLNRNYALVDTIRDTIFHNEEYDGKPLGTVTLFQGDLRIATNVRNANGTRAIGTRVSRAVRDVTLENGEPYTDRAFVVNDWYLTAYDPIRDPDDQVIGMLYVGVLERKYLAYREQLVRSFGGIMVAGTVVALVLGLLLAFWLSRPIGRLRRAAERMSAGDLAARAEQYNGPFHEIHSLNRAYNAMADSLVKRGNDLSMANDALTSSNQALARLNQNYMDMLEFVTHELKSPLASCMFGLDSIRAGFLGPVTAQQQKTLDSTQRNLEHLNVMIASYLNLSRIEKDELAFTPREVAFRAEVVEPLKEQMAGQLDSARMTLEFAPDEDVRLWGDPELLKIVMENLLSNAVKYGQAGTPIRVEHAAGDGGAVRVRVLNQGRGIAAGDLDKLFRKFSRLDVAELRARKGTGLGLFITREIIQRHGGRIWAESREHEWAAFCFELPPRGEEPPPDSRPAPRTKVDAAVAALWDSLDRSGSGSGSGSASGRANGPGSASGRAPGKASDLTT
jgi:two-component system NtrC family sensor kinase